MPTSPTPSSIPSACSTTASTRSSSEISASCDKEGANFLALNLANQTVTRWRKVQEGRKMYGEQINGDEGRRKPATYTEKLLFQVQSGTGDPNQFVMGVGPNQPKQ